MEDDASFDPEGLDSAPSDDDDEDEQVQVGTLQPVQLFGEHALIGSAGVAAPSAIVTRTHCELLQIPTTLIDPSVFSRAEIDAIIASAPPNPSEADIEARLVAEGALSKVATQLLSRIPKHRWPVDRRRIRNLPGGLSEIVPASQVPGSKLTAGEVGLEELLQMTKPPTTVADLIGDD
jgi:hypothetical protein